MLTRKYILLAVIFVGIFFYKQIHGREVFYCCDNLAINIPSKVFLTEELRSGRFPIRNPYILSGSPFLADINLGLLYPLNALYFLFSPFSALTIGIYIDYIVAFLGMYILVRSLKTTKTGSFLSAVIFTFSGTLVTYTNNIPMLQVASLLPWIMWGWIIFFRYPTKYFFLILTLLLSLQIIAGHPQLTYYTWLLGLSFVFIVVPISVKKRGFLLLSVAGMAILISSIQLIPFIDLALHSTRIGRGFEYAGFDSLHPFNLLRFIIPNLVGNLSKGTDWIQGGSVYGYVGTLPLILLVFIPLKNKFAKFFLGVAVVSLTLAFGKYIPIFYLAYKLIPGIGSFRSPQHFLLLYTLAVAILSGFSVDYVLENNPKKYFFRLLWATGIVLIVISALLTIPDLHIVLPVRKFGTLSFASQKIIIQMIADNMMLSGMIAVSTALVTRFFWRKTALAKTFLMLAVFGELFLFARNGLVSINKKQTDIWLQEGNEMAERMREPGEYRIFVSPKLYANPVKKQFGVDYMAKEAEWQIAILRTNINMLYHLATIDGYASLIDRSYKELFGNGQSDPTGIDFGDMSSVDWDRFKVRYILAAPDEKIFRNNPQFRQVWSNQDQVLYKK